MDNESSPLRDAMGDWGRRKLIGMGNRIIVWDKPKIECVRVVLCGVVELVVCHGSTRRDHRSEVKGGEELWSVGRLFLEENRTDGARSSFYCGGRSWVSRWLDRFVRHDDVWAWWVVMTSKWLFGVGGGWLDDCLMKFLEGLGESSVQLRRPFIYE